MKTRVQIVTQPLDGATSANTVAVAVHIPQHNDERVPVPILSTTGQLGPHDVPDSHRRPMGKILVARSRHHSIAEGSRAAAAPTSLQTELWSLNMARANFDELLFGYESFLHRRPPPWRTECPEALVVRGFLLGDQSDLTDQDPAALAMEAICLIRQTKYLFDQQIAALEKAFFKGRRRQRARNAR